jgi:uncharacterized protein HemX
MLRQSTTVKTLAASAALVASLGLGAVLVSPGVAQAQEETTTTVVEDPSNATTDTTVATDDSTTTDNTGNSDRAATADHNCDDAGTKSDTTATT